MTRIRLFFCFVCITCFVVLRLMIFLLNYSLTNKTIDFFWTKKRKDVPGAFDDFVRVSVSNR